MGIENEKLAMFLDLINQRTGKLEARRAVSVDEYVANYDLQKIVERELQEGIQACIDAGLRLIGLRNLRHSEDYSGVFRVLAENGVIRPDLEAELRELVSFRNVLVHEYFRIDPKQVFKRLQGAPSVFRKFARSLVEFCSRLGADEPEGVG